jgi:hypothetical protein
MSELTSGFVPEDVWNRLDPFFCEMKDHGVIDEVGKYTGYSTKNSLFSNKVRKKNFSCRFFFLGEISKILIKTLNTLCLEEDKTELSIKIEGIEKRALLFSDIALLEIVFAYALKNIFLRLPTNGIITVKFKHSRSNITVIIQDNGYYLDEKTNTLLLKNKGIERRHSLIFEEAIKILRIETSFQHLSVRSHKTILDFPCEL